MEHFILVTISFAFANALIAFDCNKDQTLQLEVSLVDIQPCLEKVYNITTEKKHIQLVQPKLYDTTPFFRCQIEIQHLISRCGRSIDTMHDAGLYSEVLDIGREGCRTLIRERYFFYKGIKIEITKSVSKEQVSVTTFGTITSSGGCESGGTLYANGKSYDRAIRQSSFSIILEEGMLKLDIENKKVIYFNGESCHYEKLSCLSANLGFLYWETITPISHCPDRETYEVIYEGIGDKVIEFSESGEFTSYFIHYADYDFQIGARHRRNRICGIIAIQTEHPKLLIIEKDQFGFTLVFNNSRLNDNINIMTYFNSKLLYIVRHMKEQMTSLYEKVSLDRCMAEKKISHNMLSMAYMSPQNFAYEFMESAGYTATVRGEVVYISKCEAVSVNFTTTAECTLELPITYKGIIHYLQPRTRIISTIGSSVDCSNVMGIKYKLNDVWYTVSNGLIHTKDPCTMKISPLDTWEFKEIQNLAKTGIYTQQDLDNVQKIIMSPIEHDVLTMRINSAFRGDRDLPQGISVINSLSANELETLAQTTFQKLWGNIGIFVFNVGNYFSFFLGSFIIFKFFKYFLDNLINITVLYKTFGWSWKILLFWWENVVHLFLHHKEKSEPQRSTELENMREMYTSIPTLRTDN